MTPMKMVVTIIKNSEKSRMISVFIIFRFETDEPEGSSAAPD